MRIVQWATLASVALMVASCRSDPGITPEEAQELLTEVRALRQELNARPPPQAAQSPRRPESLSVSIDGRPALDRADAKLTIVEFTDYQCPYCKAFKGGTLEELKRSYVDTGVAKLVIYDLPLPIHPQAAKAAEAARCAGDQGKYWEMHDQLFADGRRLAVEDLKNHADAVGLDQRRFSDCLDGGKFADSVRKDVVAALELGVGGTPTFVLGREDSGNVSGKVLRGALPLGAFKTEIERLIGDGSTR